MKDGVKPFYSGGLRFSCKRCSVCCRFDPGFVFLNDDETERLCRKLKMKNDEFKKTYCRYVDTDGGMRLSLKEKSNNDCIFWNEGCMVYDERPLQCRTYPFWSFMLTSKKIWEETSACCPGAGTGELHSFSEINGHLKAVGV